MHFPPIHPVLAHLPIAFVLLSVIADVCARRSRLEASRARFRAIGYWSLVAGLAGGILAIGAGYVDLHRESLSRDSSEMAELHSTLGWIFGVCLLVLTAWRWLIWHRGQMTITTGYLVAAFLVLGLTAFEGWYGGEMVYAFGTGVAPAGQGTETAAAAQSRLAAIRSMLQPGAALGGAEAPGETNAGGMKR